MTDRTYEEMIVGNKTIQVEVTKLPIEELELDPNNRVVDVLSALAAVLAKIFVDCRRSHFPESADHAREWFLRDLDKWIAQLSEMPPVEGQRQ